MRVSSLKRWHWILVALVIGFACGGVRQGTADEDRIDQYERLFTDPQKFEDAITTEASGLRLFRNITVYPYHVPGAPAGRNVAYLATGQYWDGVPQIQKNGQSVAHYVSACFIASAPFQPRTALLGANRNATFDSVIDYLAVMHDKAGVQFHYAWWWWATTPLALWVMGSLIVVGGIWPTLFNLIVFGRLTRPAEEKGVSLKDVKGTTAPTRAPGPEIDEEALAALDHELEESLAHLDSSDAPATATTASAAPRALNGDPLDPVAVAAAESREFGAKRDDFYPTELRVHPHK